MISEAFIVWARKIKLGICTQQDGHHKNQENILLGTYAIFQQRALWELKSLKKKNTAKQISLDYIWVLIHSRGPTISHVRTTHKELWQYFWVAVYFKDGFSYYWIMMATPWDLIWQPHGIWYSNPMGSDMATAVVQIAFLMKVANKTNV